jgi:hypothetical protein
VTDGEAQEIVRMVESAWGADLGAAGREIWRRALIPYDAHYAALAIPELLKREHYRPAVSDIIELVEAWTRRERDQREQERMLGKRQPTCSTCADDGWVVLFTRQPVETAWMNERGLQAKGAIEEMAPCPDCQVGKTNELVAYGETGFWRGRTDLQEQVRRRAEQQPTTAAKQGKQATPEWVWVWAFMRANDDFRSLPQQEGWETEPDRLDQEQYEEMRVYWQQAGSPHLMHKLPVPLPEV